MTDNIERKLIIITTLLGAFSVPFLVTSANVALPAIGREFNASPTTLSWVISATLLTTAMVVLPIGKLSDIYGRKKMMFIGSAILTITSLLCGFADSVALLIVYRSIQGIGGAMLATTVVSIVSSAFPKEERGKALGVNIAFTYIGLSTGPFISGFIVDYFSWREIFFFFVPIGLLMLLLISRIKQEWKETQTKKVDYSGAFIYAVAIFAVIWGLSNSNSSVYAKAGLAAGFIFLYLFILFERRTEAPLIDIHALIRNRVLVFSSLAAFINYSSTFAISYMMSLYLQYIKGIDPQFAGMVLLVQPAFQAVFSPIAGFVSDRVDPRYVATAGMSVITVSLFFAGLLGAASPIAMIVVLLSVVGIGYALFSSPNANSIMSSVEQKDYGVASGILATSRTVGQSFSMAMTTLIVSLYIGKETVTSETAHLFVNSFRSTFMIFSALCLLGVFASLARGKREQKRGEVEVC